MNGKVLFGTPRMIVSCFGPGDGDSFFRINGDPKVMQYIRPPKNRKASDQFLSENLALYKDGALQGRYKVETRNARALVGTFSFLVLAGTDDCHAGYALLPEAWGYGYATELLVAGTAFYFQTTHKERLYAIAESENRASIRVMEKAGYRFQSESLENEKRLLLYCIHASRMAAS
jgi:ribosomal-protein-alanine N-acetyltransferase